MLMHCPALRKRLALIRAGGGDFAFRPAALHHPAALCEAVWLLVSAPVGSDWNGWIIPLICQKWHILSMIFGYVPRMDA